MIKIRAQRTFVIISAYIIFILLAIGCSSSTATANPPSMQESLATKIIFPSETQSPTNIFIPTNTPESIQKQAPSDTSASTIIPLPSSTPTSSPNNIINLVITTIFYNGSGQAEPDEYVEIRNMGTNPVQLSGWTLQDQSDHIYTFPVFVIDPDKVCRIYTNEDHSEWCGFNYHFSKSAIWNNSGDCGYLRDNNSNLIDDYCY